jgi:hypothetical protein
MGVREESRMRLLDAALALLCRNAVRGIEKLLSPEALQDATRAQPGAQGVSRHTVYRLWPDRSDIVMDAARHVADPAVYEDLAAFAMATNAYADLMRDQELRRQVRGELDDDSKKAIVRDGFHEVLDMSFKMDLEARGMPASWALQGAALTSSPLWRGPRPDAAAEATGRAILAARAAFAADVNERWSGLFRGAMAVIGRRPRPNMTVERVVQLMLNLYDGSLQNLFVDPQLNAPEIGEERRRELLDETIHEAVEAIFELAWVYTEPGYLEDPRRPTDSSQDNLEMFDRVVSTATDLYAQDATHVVQPKEAAARANVTEQAASVLFPDPGDLADSVVRGLVASAGLEFSESQMLDLRPMIRSVLTRVHQAVTSHPGAITATRSHPPTHPGSPQPFLDELTGAIAGALRSPKINCPNPEETANTLMKAALAVGDEAVAPMLKVIPPADAT